MIREVLCEGVQNSSSLTQACSSLIHHPVAKSSRNAAFLRHVTSADISEVGSVPFSRRSSTELSFKLGAVVIDMGLCNAMALSKLLTSGTLRSMFHFSLRGSVSADLYCGGRF